MKTMHSRLFLLSVAILQLLSGASCILLEKEGDIIAFEEGTVEEVILDCPYDLEDNDTEGLVIQWRHEDAEAPFYQWIPVSPPTVHSSVVDKVDVNHESSDEAYKKHRALRLLRPSVQFSGTFTCIVSAFKDEKTHSRKIIAYSPPTDMIISLVQLNDTHLAVTCSVDNTYPQPEVVITRSATGGKIPIEDLNITKSWANEKYNLTATSELRDEILLGETIFECHLTLPQTEFEIFKRIRYSPRDGPKEQTVRASAIGLHHETVFTVLALGAFYRFCLHLHW